MKRTLISDPPQGGPLETTNPFVAVVYRSTSDSPNTSHAGLGICAVNTSKTLLQHGIRSQPWAVTGGEQILSRLRITPGVTHILIQAPWIPSAYVEQLAGTFPNVQFAINCHSNVGFLQVEPQAVDKMLDLVAIEQTTHNVHCAGNSLQFCNWISDTYQAPCTWLPNLYYVDSNAEAPRPLWNGGTLRLGIFGAPRLQKNVMTQAAAFIQIAQMLKTPTEIWLNAGRDEGAGSAVRSSVKKAIARSPFASYHEFQWAPWPEFRRFMGSCNGLGQVSYSESFNQVVADGISQGTPSVISPAIRWAPKYWQADPDDAEDIARVMLALLRNPLAQRDGLQSLRKHNYESVTVWKRYLSGTDFTLDHP